MENNSLENKEKNASTKKRNLFFKSWGEKSHPRILRIKKWSRENRRFLVTLISGIILVGLMIFQTLYMTNQIGMLTNQLSYLLDTNSIMQEELNSLENNIASTLEESNSMLAGYDIRIEDINFAEESYTASIELKLKEFTAETTVGMYFGSNLYMLERDSNSYYGKVVLPISENYDGNVTVLVTNGETRNTEILKNYTGLMHRLENVLYGHLEVFPTYADGVIKLPGEIQAEVNGNDYFEFQSLGLVVEANSKVVYDLDYYHQEEPKLSVLEEEETEELGFTEEIEDTESNIRQENSLTNSDLETKLDADQEIEIPTTEEAEESLGSGGDFAFSVGEIADIPEGTEVRIYLKLKSTEGYEFRYLIFEGTTSTEKVTSPQEPVELVYEGWVFADDYFPYTYTIYDLYGGSHTE